MSPQPRTHLDEQVDGQLARHPLILKRALERVAMAAIDNTLEDRHTIREYMRKVAALDVTPKVVGAYLRQAASVIAAVERHTARQSGEVVDDVESRFADFPAEMQSALVQLGETLCASAGTERQTAATFFGRLAVAPGLHSATVARIAAALEDAAVAAANDEDVPK